MRLIDADALEKSLEKLWNVHDDQDFANKDVWREIENAPTIDTESSMSGDLIRRQDAIEAVSEALRTPIPCYGNDLLQDCMTLAKAIVKNIPSVKPEPKWIPVTEALPEDKTWYLGIFKESDTGYCISVPFVCYYARRKTMITTKDYWILRGYDDIYSFSEYFKNLECVAWMPLPEPWRGEE